MGHTPYGYRIENGIAVIVKTTANQVQQLFMRTIPYKRCKGSRYCDTSFWCKANVAKQALSWR